MDRSLFLWCLSNYKLRKKMEKEAIIVLNKRLPAIDFFKWLSSILVICSHVRPFIGISENIDFVFTQLFCRIAVPFFWMCTGFFIGMKLKKDGADLLKKRAISFAKIYLLLTICYCYYSPMGVHLTITLFILLWHSL